MLNDLQGCGNLEQRADVIVIGAGTAGLPTSVMLARDNMRVICLESGGERQVEDVHPLNEVVQRGTPYGGAAHGRFRCLGGTSTRWGGALIPFQEADLEQSDWPITMSDLEPHLRTVEALFGLPDGPYDDPDFPFWLGDRYVARMAKWPPFKKRNVVSLVGRESRNCKSLNLWLNATVTEIIAPQQGAEVEVVARSLLGDCIHVSASRLIIAAGAIETTRLVLLLDRSNRGIVSALSPMLGCYLSDHISFGVAEIEVAKRSAFNKIIGFRFEAGGMRNLRLELATRAPERTDLRPHFIHIASDATRPGGFDALRELLRCIQQRRLPAPRLGIDLVANGPWLLHAAWWRYIHKRLLFPAGSRLVVHVVLEQEPVPENCITLSSERVDSFGLPMAEIDWRISEADVDRMHRATDLLEATWQVTDFAEYGDLHRFQRKNMTTGVQLSEGIFHPSGSTRMSHDAATGVVDRDLRLFALPQIQLLSTSVLPTAGGANPTMMLMLLAMRCVVQHRMGLPAATSG